MKFSKELEWLRPFVLMSDSYIPNLNKLQAVCRIPLKKDKRQTVQGSCLQDENKHYKIMIYTEYNAIVKYKPLTLKRKKYSKLDILNTLAHELAHMIEWDHTPKRQIIESQIAISFMLKMHLDGYISEEDESKRGFNHG